MPRAIRRLAVLAAPLAIAACAAPAKHAAAPAASSAPAASAPKKTVVALAPPPAPGHVSELESVTNDEADPRARELFKERMAQAAVPLVETTAPQRVTATALDDTRRGVAPGMVPHTAVYAATLAEGQRASLPVKIGPRQCFTYVAQGGLGMIEVDLFLTRGDGADAHILAEDPRTGPIGVIGGHGKCFSSDTPVDGSLHAAARRGSGLVLVQVYRK